MKVAVYSGTFDPFHKGHLNVIGYLLDKEGFDMVYLVVSPRNPFKDASLCESGRQRMEAVREAISRHGLDDRVKVDDIEFTLPVPSYTINTLDALREREPRNRFTLVIGGDNLKDLLSWKEGTRILTEYGTAVYPRRGNNIVHDCAVLKEKHRNAERLFGDGKHRCLHIKLLRDAPLVDISSTQLREMASKGENITGFLA